MIKQMLLAVTAATALGTAAMARDVYVVPRYDSERADIERDYARDQLDKRMEMRRRALDYQEELARRAIDRDEDED
jgi:hypothetical protein